MKRLLLIALTIAAVALIAGCSKGSKEPGEAKGPNIKDGLWEITTKVEMQGAPVPFAIPEQKITQCITKKDAVPQKAETNQECKMISSKVDGDTVTWVMECNAQEGTKTHSEGRVTYKGEAFDGVTNVTVTPPGQETMKMTQTMSGRRIGDCKQEKAEK
jgi:hypothetical protein